jgi:hypothetical protein
MEWVRLRLMEYCLDKKNYENAEEFGMKIMRKQALSKQFDKESMKRIFETWDHTMTSLIERKLAVVQKEWNISRSYFAINSLINLTILSEMGFRFDRIRILVESNSLERSNSWERYNKLKANIFPYSARIGLVEKDVNPESGSLEFGCSGGIALDYNFRSVGASLEQKRPVVAIRLRRWSEETKVKLENLSIWISDDNKFYRKYTGKITFSNDIRVTTFDNLDFSCQYLKVHFDLDNEKYTLGEDFKNILEIYGPPDFS